MGRAWNKKKIILNAALEQAAQGAPDDKTPEATSSMSSPVAPEEKTTEGTSSMNYRVAPIEKTSETTSLITWHFAPDMKLLEALSSITQQVPPEKAKPSKSSLKYHPMSPEESSAEYEMTKQLLNNLDLILGQRQIEANPVMWTIDEAVAEEKELKLNPKKSEKIFKQNRCWSDFKPRAMTNKEIAYTKELALKLEKKKCEELAKKKRDQPDVKPGLPLSGDIYNAKELESNLKRFQEHVEGHLANAKPMTSTSEAMCGLKDSQLKLERNKFAELVKKQLTFSQHNSKPKPRCSPSEENVDFKKLKLAIKKFEELAGMNKLGQTGDGPWAMTKQAIEDAKQLEIQRKKTEELLTNKWRDLNVDHKSCKIDRPPFKQGHLEKKKPVDFGKLSRSFEKSKVKPEAIAIPTDLKRKESEDEKFLMELYVNIKKPHWNPIHSEPDAWTRRKSVLTALFQIRFRALDWDFEKQMACLKDVNSGIGLIKYSMTDIVRKTNPDGQDMSDQEVRNVLCEFFGYTPKSS